MRLTLALLLSCVVGVAAAAPPAVGEFAPTWTGQGAKGRMVTFVEGPRERPAILLFWATWCPYCRALMPHVQRVLDDVGPRALDVYALDILEEEGADPAGELRARGQNFTLIAPADSVAERYGVVGTPTLLLVGRDGRVAYVRSASSSPDQVEAALRARVATELKPR